MKTEADAQAAMGLYKQRAEVLGALAGLQAHEKEDAPIDVRIGGLRCPMNVFLDRGCPRAAAVRAIACEHLASELKRIDAALVAYGFNPDAGNGGHK